MGGTEEKGMREVEGRKEKMGGTKEKGMLEVERRKAEKKKEKGTCFPPLNIIYLEFLSRLRRIAAKARRTYVANFVVCDGVGVINN